MLKAAALKAGLKPTPPKLDAMGSKNILPLRAAKGKARDELYVSQQKNFNQSAFALKKGYATDATSAPPKSLPYRPTEIAIDFCSAQPLSFTSRQ